MKIEELVSDWELEEIRHELRIGVAPDIVAFRHGVPSDALPKSRSYSKKRGKKTKSRTARIWTAAEKNFVRDNYQMHKTYTWPGWKTLERSWDSIRHMAQKLRSEAKDKEGDEG